MRVADGVQLAAKIINIQKLSSRGKQFNVMSSYNNLYYDNKLIARNLHIIKLMVMEACVI